MGAAYTVGNVSDASLRALNYSPQLERLRGVPPTLRKRGWDFRPLEDLAGEIGATYAKVLQRVDCAPPYGDELLSQVDVFAADPSGRRIRGDLMGFVEDLRIKRGDILIAGAGQIGESTLFGRAVIADGRLVGKLAAGDIMVLRFGEPNSISALFTYAFLLSSAGLQAIRACAYGTSIPRMRPDLLARVPVPVPEDDIQKRVAACVQEAMIEREKYLREIRAARGVLDQLPEMRDAQAMCRQRKGRAVVWDGLLRTLTAWTYASHGGALAFLQKRWRRRVADAIPDGGAFYGLLRQRTPCSPGFGVPLISQRDAHAIRQIPSWIVRAQVPARALFSPPNSIVMAGRGTLGEGEIFARPAFVSPRVSRFALTQDLLRLVPNAQDCSLLFAYLSTLVGRRLLRSCAVGTKVMQLRIDLIRELPFPELEATALATLEGHHERAVAAYDSAAEAETEAVRIVEEEVLPAWLD